VPLVRVLVLVFALLHATGLSDAMEAACAEDCADGDDCGDEGCAPICPTCHCAPCPAGVATSAMAAVLPVPTAPTVAAFHDVDDVVNSPDPREILHVPITLRV
jgi:hypothetical protein